MAGRGDGRLPGIASLLELLDDAQLREALEYDLIAMGCRLRWFEEDPRGQLTWRDLVVVVRQALPGTALARAIDPEASVWDLHSHLLAGVIDVLNVANWQRDNPKRKGKPPKPIKRPGVSDPNSESLGRAPLPVGEMADWLGGKFADAA